MIIDDDGSIRSEKRIEVITTECVRVTPRRAENHQIRHVHDAYTEERDQLAEESSCCDHLERNFCTDADEHAELFVRIILQTQRIALHIWIHSLVNARKFPNRGTSHAMLHGELVVCRTKGTKSVRDPPPPDLAILWSVACYQPSD